jgi:hypothetical protein
MLKTAVTLLSMMVIALCVSCGRGSEDQGGGSAAPAPSTVEPTPTPEEPPAKAAPTMDPAAFTAQLPSSACDTIQACKNEEMRGYVEFMMAFMGGFASMDKSTGLAPIMSKMGEAMKAEKRILINRDECEPILAKLLELNGMIGAPLTKSLESKRAEFDAEKATQCIENFKTPPAQCSEAKQLTESIKMSKAEGFEKQFQGPLRDYLKTCGEVILGTVDEGAACDTDSECKLGKCRRQDGDTKLCQKSSS